MGQEQDFWELMRDGQTCEVLSEKNDLIFVGKLHLTDRQTAVEVTEASGGVVPPVYFNTKFKIKLYFSGLGTRLIEGTICGNTRYFWRMDNLCSLHRHEARQSFRQRAPAKAKVFCVSSIYAPGFVPARKANPTVDCQIEDLSLGGILIRCKEHYDVGEWLFVKDVVFLEKEHFVFSVQIRWSRMDGRRDYLYGCKFADLTAREQDRLFQTIFELQRKEVQSKRR